MDAPPLPHNISSFVHARYEFTFGFNSILVYISRGDCTLVEELCVDLRRALQLRG